MLLLGLPVGNSVAQNVQYSGKLRIGLGDSDNEPGFRVDFGFPRCGPANLTPGLPNKTLERLLVNARGTQIGTGPGADLVFNAVGAGLGDAEVRTLGSCRWELDNAPQGVLRSRTISMEVRWSSNLGSYKSMISVLTSPATPTATYRLSAGGGIAYPGSTLATSGPLYIAGQGAVTLNKGANHFGGGAPI